MKRLAVLPSRSLLLFLTYPLAAAARIDSDTIEGRHGFDLPACRPVWLAAPDAQD